MDGPNARYLHPIAGLDAAMWVPPSRGQLFWLRRVPALFAPARGTGRGLARWWAIATVPLDTAGGVPARAGREPQPARYRGAPRRPARRAGRLRHR
jgi:hypothetical protein